MDVDHIKSRLVNGNTVVTETLLPDNLSASHLFRRLLVASTCIFILIFGIPMFIDILHNRVWPAAAWAVIGILMLLFITSLVPVAFVLLKAAQVHLPRTISFTAHDVTITSVTDTMTLPLSHRSWFIGALTWDRFGLILPPAEVVLISTPKGWIGCGLTEDARLSITELLTHSDAKWDAAFTWPRYQVRLSGHVIAGILIGTCMGYVLDRVAGSSTGIFFLSILGGMYSYVLARDSALRNAGVVLAEQGHALIGGVTLAGAGGAWLATRQITATLAVSACVTFIAWTAWKYMSAPDRTRVSD